MIEMKNVYKKYPNGVIAVNGISIRIKQGNLFMSWVQAVPENPRLLK